MILSRVKVTVDMHVLFVDAAKLFWVHFHQIFTLSNDWHEIATVPFDTKLFFAANVAGYLFKFYVRLTVLILTPLVCSIGQTTVAGIEDVLSLIVIC